jgi:hypothetical protein
VLNRGWVLLLGKRSQSSRMPRPQREGGCQPGPAGCNDGIKRIS